MQLISRQRGTSTDQFSGSKCSDFGGTTSRYTIGTTIAGHGWRTSNYHPTYDTFHPSIGAHIALSFSRTPDRKQLDQIILLLNNELGLTMENCQQLDNRQRVIFVPSEGDFTAASGERLEATAAVLRSWIDQTESLIVAYAIVQ